MRVERRPLMRWQLGLITVAFLSSPGWARAEPSGAIFPPGPAPVDVAASSPVQGTPPVVGRDQPRFASNRNFPNFIGFMSNPLQNIDPRSLTQIVPIFGSAWVSTTPALPDGDFQLYGPALSLAVPDRF